MLLKQGLLDANDRGLLQIDWKLLSACNYRCSYCFDQKKPAREDFSLTNILKTAQKILDLNRSRYLFRFVGGEPTLFPHLKGLVEYIGDRNTNAFFEIISNGSQSASYFRDLFADLPAHVCRVHLSVHLEYAQQGRIAEILKTIVSLRQQALVRVMFHPQRSAESIDFTRFLLQLAKQVPFDIRLNALRKAPDFIGFDSRYTSADFAAMNELDAEIGAVYQTDRYYPLFYDDQRGAFHVPHSHAYRNGLCAFDGFTCLAGLHTMHIEPDLHWRPATCHLFAKSSRPFCADGEILAVTAKKCTFAQCGCDANYIVPKFRDPADALRHQAQSEMSARA